MNWQKIHDAAAAKQELLNKSAAANGMATKELVVAVQKFNDLLATLNNRERAALNQLA